MSAHLSSAICGRRAAALALGLVTLMLVSGCFTSPTVPTPPRADRDGAPSEPISRADIEALPDPEVRSELRSRVGNQSPYVVFGKTYDVLPDASGYQETGTASWYGTKFHGRNTSSGEPYDMLKLTAAHRTLPLPSFLRVTNLRNGRSTVVRVNDRGPFHDDRLIDLSYAAAVKLGYDLQGTAPVRVELLAQPPLAAARPSAAPTRMAGVRRPAEQTTLDRTSDRASRTLYLQAGAFSSETAARRLREALQSLLGEQAKVQEVAGSDALLRVRIGPLRDLSLANELQRRLADTEFGVPLLVWE